MPQANEKSEAALLEDSTFNVITQIEKKTNENKKKFEQAGVMSKP